MLKSFIVYLTFPDRPGVRRARLSPVHLAPFTFQWIAHPRECAGSPQRSCAFTDPCLRVATWVVLEMMRRTFWCWKGKPVDFNCDLRKLKLYVAGLSWRGPYILSSFTFQLHDEETEAYGRRISRGWRDSSKKMDEISMELRT